MISLNLCWLTSNIQLSLQIILQTFLLLLKNVDLVIFLTRQPIRSAKETALLPLGIIESGHRFHQIPPLSISAPSNYSSSMRIHTVDHMKYHPRNTRKGIISTEVALNGCASPDYSFAPFACIPSPGTLSLLLSEITGCNVSLSDPH